MKNVLEQSTEWALIHIIRTNAKKQTSNIYN